AAVANHAIWAMPWPSTFTLEWRNRIHQRQGFLRVVPVGTGQPDGERHASRITNQMTLAPSLGAIRGIWTGLRTAVHQRQNRADWEMPYLAVINCRGWHRSRRYFSKWHEVIHLLLDGRQLRFAFRKRAAERKHPEEVLVDKIAGELAFHPDLFGPVFQAE